MRCQQAIRARDLSLQLTLVRCAANHEQNHVLRLLRWRAGRANEGVASVPQTELHQVLDRLEQVRVVLSVDVLDALCRRGVA